MLNLLLYSAVFIPLERLFALRADQPVFRRHWLVDLTYFFVNSLLIEVLTILTLKPALILFDWARLASVSGAVGVAPARSCRCLHRLLVADFTQYWVHRTFHAVPFLWRFHAIHHSAEEMDWLAGSRLHLVDVIVTRGLTYVPIFVLGFSNAALMVYVFLVAGAGDVHPRQRAMGVPPAAPARRDAGVPPLAPQRRRARRSTRTSRCTPRSGTSCSAPTTCRIAGRPVTA